MKKYTLKLHDAPTDEVRVPADTLLEAIGALIEGAQRATRLFVEGESVRSGPRPAWLKAACRLEITGLRAGSAVVPLEAPPLASAAPDRFEPSVYTPLFDEPAASLLERNSAVDLFGNALAAALAGERDTLLADRALLDSCVRFVRAAGTDYRQIELYGVAGRSAPVIARQEDLSRIELLHDETPPPRAVRVAGVLDTISASSNVITLNISANQTVQGLLEKPDREKLRALFGTHVVISGMASFRPSGKVLNVNVEHIGPARSQDAIWQRVPVARPGVTSSVYTPTPQDETSGVSAFFGIWPGEESDEELLQAVEALG